MAASISGLDRYSSSLRSITISREGAHVLITVEGSEGGGEALLTPDQAIALAGGIEQQAKLVSKASEVLSGEFDVR